MVSGSSLRCILNPCKAQVDHNLFEIVSDDKDILDALGIYLNSGTCFLQRELIGRANLGDGALKVEGIDWERILVPDKDRLLKLKKNTGKVFEKVCKRDIVNIKAESKKKDRIEFEKAILESLELPTELAEQILAAVVGLVEERHLLPKLRSSKKKKRVAQDLEKLKEEISNEILPDGVMKFPDGFIKGWPKVECKEISVPTAGRLKLGESFFDKQEICDAEGQHLMDVGSKEEGKFLVYVKKKDEAVVRLPESKTAIKKAVQEYEMYLRDIKRKLYAAFMEKCGDHNVSENLAGQVLEENGLPDVR
jgi:hypothetical protein